MLDAKAELEASALCERIDALLASGACCCENTADQMIVFMALARGTSRLRAPPATTSTSQHLPTVLALVRRLTGATIRVTDAEDGCQLIECDGVGAQAQVSSAASEVSIPVPSHQYQLSTPAHVARDLSPTQPPTPPSTLSSVSRGSPIPELSPESSAAPSPVPPAAPSPVPPRLGPSPALPNAMQSTDTSRASPGETSAVGLVPVERNAVN